VEELAAGLPASRLLALEARVDSAILWALTLERLSAGLSLGAALAGVVTDVCGITTGRLNLLITDGTEIAATALGDTLYWICFEGATTVASEPSDDRPGWHRVPDGSLLTANPDHVAVVELTGLQKETLPS
jgi:glutamine amidotransferase